MYHLAHTALFIQISSNSLEFNELTTIIDIICLKFMSYFVHQPRHFFFFLLFFFFLEILCWKSTTKLVSIAQTIHLWIIECKNLSLSNCTSHFFPSKFLIFIKVPLSKFLIFIIFIIITIITIIFIELLLIFSLKVPLCFTHRHKRPWTVVYHKSIFNLEVTPIDQTG